MIREYIIKISDEVMEEEIADRPQELVRCEHCKHGSLYCTEDVCGKTLIECNRPDLGDVIEIHEWNWFCADGEPKESGEVE